MTGQPADVFRLIGQAIVADAMVRSPDSAALRTALRLIRAVYGPDVGDLCAGLPMVEHVLATPPEPEPPPAELRRRWWR